MDIFTSGAWDIIFGRLTHDCTIVILASAAAMMAFASISRFCMKKAH